MNKSSIKHLLAAAHTGDLTVIMAHQRNNPNIHWKDIRYEETGDTLLHVSSRLGKDYIINYLLRHYSTESIDCRNKHNKTALHEAAQFSHPDIVEMLLEYGADVNALKNGDWTPLMLACSKYCVETVRVLLEKGASVHCCNKDGWTALHIAARAGLMEIVDELLEKSPDIKKTTKNGRSLLHISICHGNIDIFKRLVDLGLDVNTRDRCGNTPLHEVVLSGSVETFRILLSMGADVKARNRNGFTVLHLAVSNDNVDVVEEVVLKNFIPVDDKAKWGFTPLHCCARANSHEMYDLLVKLGADENIMDDHGRTAREYFTGQV